MPSMRRWHAARRPIWVQIAATNSDILSKVVEAKATKRMMNTLQIVGVGALGGLLVRVDFVAVVRFALLIRRRNSTLCYVPPWAGWLCREMRGVAQRRLRNTKRGASCGTV
jgi:hypothetical protein